MGHGTRRRDGATRLGVFAVSLLVTALLLFTWPFVRVPRLHLVPAYLHLVAAWTLVIGALIVLSRAVRRSRTRTGDRDA
jgi:hypothetical protein